MRVKNVLGKILYFFIARHMPSSSFLLNIGQKNIRRFTAKMFCKYIGKNVNIDKGAYFTSKLSIDENSGVGKNSVLGTVSIGKNVMMGPECLILSANHNYDRTDIPMIKQGVAKDEPVIIGDNVWIGQRVIILPGVEIKNGAVIGAGSVVTKTVNENTVVAGNPARVIKVRR